MVFIFYIVYKMVYPQVNELRKQQQLIV